MPEIIWENAVKLDSKRFVCGYCSNPLTSNEGFQGTHIREPTIGYDPIKTPVFIYICHDCGRPTYFGLKGAQIPKQLPGSRVFYLPKDVELIYWQARACCTVGSFTAAALCLRTLLMYIAVSKGANEGLKFVQYVDYLDKKNYIPPDGREWVDHIKDMGNIAAHEIKIIPKKDALDLIDFTEGLLRFIYEYPGKIKAKKQNIREHSKS